jgi:hypothetical protein
VFKALRYSQSDLPIMSRVVTICTTSLTFNNSTFCPHNVFMCFVWISEQTAIISLYSINGLVFTTETVCLLRGTDWIHIGVLVTYASRDPQTASKCSHLKKPQLSHSVSKDECHTTKTFRSHYCKNITFHKELITPAVHTHTHTLISLHNFS